MKRSTKLRMLLLATLVLGGNAFLARQSQAAESCDANACNSGCYSHEACAARGCAYCRCITAINPPFYGYCNDN